MAYSRNLSKMAILDYKGLSSPVKDCHGLSWTVMDCHGLSWTIMDCHGLIWDNSIYWLVSYWQTYIITRVRTNSSNYSFFRIVAHRIVYSTTVKLQLWEVCLGPELFVVFVHVCDNSISVLSANKSKHLSTPKEYWFSRDGQSKKRKYFVHFHN